jgi:hypothetical protein
LKEASNNSHGLPNYGNIVDRQRAYLNKEEFKDPSGKSPIAYTKIMKKLKLSEEQVRNECEKMGLTLDPINLEEKTVKKSGRPKQIKPEKPAKEIKAKGRPKKSKKVLELAGEEEDLFASLVMAANSSQVSDSLRQDAVVIVTTVSEATKETEIVLSEPTKETEIVLSEPTKETEIVLSEPKKEKVTKEAKELAKLKEKEEKALALLKEKEEKALALLKEKEEKAKEKEMKSLMLKLEKEKQKEELLEKKAALALEKVKAKELLAKQKEKKTKVSKKSEVKEVVTSVATSVANLDAEVTDEEADVVKKIMFEGKKYLKSKNTGVIYNMDQDVIGKWNEEKQRIDFNEEEESEDEYDEDM